MNYELRKRSLRNLNQGFSHDSCFVILDSSQRGFTLLEMVVSIALFSFVMLAMTSVLLSVVDADHKAQGLKSSMNNLSLALESMARNLRTGTSYTLGAPSGNGNCPSPGSNLLSFSDHTQAFTTYKLDDEGSISVTKSPSGLRNAITAPEIIVDRLCFYAVGADTMDLLQPRILLTVGGFVNNVSGKKDRTKSRFDIQTMVSQRVLDVPQN